MASPRRFQTGGFSGFALRLIVGVMGLVLVGGIAVRGFPSEGFLSLVFAARYGLPLAVMAAALAALRFSAEIRAGVVMTLLSAAAGLYVAEAVLAFKGLYPREWQNFVSPVSGDNRTMAEVVAGQRRGGKSAFPVLPPVWNLGVPVAEGIPLPLADPPHSEIIFCNETGTWLTYRSDRHGFRNPDSAWENSEIALVGDSFAAGQCVPEFESIAGLMRAADVPTVTLGRPGRGPLEQLALMREYLPAIKPRHVVWIFFEGNDFDDLAREMAVPALVRYLDPGYRQRASEEERAAVAARHAEAVMSAPPPARSALSDPVLFGLRFATLNALRTFVVASLAPPAPPEAVASGERIGNYARVIAAANKTVGEWGGRLTIVYLPAHSLALTPATKRAVAQAVGDAARAEGVAVIDPGPAIAARERETFFAPHTHYSPVGYRLVADEIMKAMPDLRKP